MCCQPQQKSGRKQPETNTSLPLQGMLWFLKAGRGRQASRAEHRRRTQRSLKCVKDNPKGNKTPKPVVFIRGHLFVPAVIWLVSAVSVWRCCLPWWGGAHALPCGWQQTQTVYFACTAKRLRLGSPFLFSQWKGEIDGYHLCATALFERYQTFHRHHWILSWANKHTCTHSRAHENEMCFFHLSSIFSFFAVGTGKGVGGVGGHVSLCAHLRQLHIHAPPCNPPTMIKVFPNKVIREQVRRAFIGHN